MIAERAGHDGQSQFRRRGIEQRARTLERHGRQRIVFRHRRDERRIYAQAGNAHLPFGLGVVRLEFLVGDRPVRHACARGNGRDRRGFPLNSYGRWRQLLLPYVTVPPPTTQP